MDYYSRYIEVAAMTKNKKGSEVVRALKSIFARHGIPEKVRSDNGPPFDSGEYARFANDWGFKITTSSPKFPRSNGEAERAVQTAKSILKKEKDQANALLAYRSTPLSCGYSPIADGKKHPFHTPNISQSIKSKASRCVEIASKRTGEQTAAAD